MPDEAEVLGLLALLLLTESRRAARVASDGSVVLLPDQDRSRWDRGLIAEGQALVRACLRRDMPGPFQIQAAINAVHSDAPTAADTDWGQILQLYDQLLVVHADTGRGAEPRRRAGRARGPGDRPRRDRRPRPRQPTPRSTSHRGELLARLGRADAAADAYDHAIALTANEAERRFLVERRDGVADRADRDS